MQTIINVYYIIIKKGTEISTFGDTEIEKNKFHHHKSLF